MPEITVAVPGMLARFTDDRRSIAVRADSVEAALDRVVESYPALEPHLFDGDGRPRPHLQLFHDGTRVDWSDAAAVELADGDELTVFQAVSGG